MNGRRGFIKGFGLLSAVIAGGTAAQTANAATAVAGPGLSNDNSSTAREAIDHLAPRNGATALTITGDNRPPEPPKPIVYAESGGYVSTYTMLDPSAYTMVTSTSTPFLIGGNDTSCTPKELNSVTMAVGKDDRLWIKIGDSWKRVAIEG
jgi:hypothetical protein